MSRTPTPRRPGNLSGRLRHLSARRAGRVALITLLILGIDSLGHLGIVIAALIMAWLITE